MKNIIFWTWCLPQTLLGFILGLIFLNVISKKKIGNTTIITFENDFLTSAGLGKYLLLHKRDVINPMTINHEQGHCKQSLKLGWLYLPTVGLVSVFWNLMGRIRPNLNENYYNRWPENWADELGGVTR